MINRISYAALGVALLAGASAANAQTDTVFAEQPRARTVETIRTVRTVEPARVTHRHVARRAPARVITTTTTRTIVRDRFVPVPEVISSAPAVTTYGDVVPPAPVVADVPYSRPLYNAAPGALVAEPAYSRPLYDVAAPVAGPAPVAAAPFVGAAPAGQSGVPLPGYRYVYEADRILVIDPYTNIAVQAIPR
jgi:hypothetical protein